MINRQQIKNSLQSNTIKLFLKTKKKIQKECAVIDGFSELTQKQNNTDKPSVYINTYHQNSNSQYQCNQQNKPSKISNQVINVLPINIEVSSSLSSINVEKENKVINQNYPPQQSKLKSSGSSIIKNQRNKKQQSGQISFNLTKNNSSKNVSFKLFPSNSNIKIPSLNNLKLNSQQKQIASYASISDEINDQQFNKKKFDSQLFRSVIVSNQNNGMLNLSHQGQIYNNLTNFLHISNTSGKTLKLKKCLSYAPNQSKVLIKENLIKSTPQQNEKKVADKKEFFSLRPSESSFVEKPVFKINCVNIQNKQQFQISQTTFLKQKDCKLNQVTQKQTQIYTTNQISKNQYKSRPPLPIKQNIYKVKDIKPFNCQKINLQNQFDFDNAQKNLRSTIPTAQAYLSQIKNQVLTSTGINISSRQYFKKTFQQKYIQKKSAQSLQVRLRRISQSSKINIQSIQRVPVLNQSYSVSSQIHKKATINILSIQNFDLGLPKTQGKTEFNQQTFIAKQTQTGMLVAIKKFKKKNIQSKLNHFIEQLKIQMMVNHQNVVKIYGIFSGEQYIYVIQEYIQQGSLYTLMKMKKNIIESQVAQKSFQVAKGIKALHEKCISHKKIKPESIVLTHGVCKIDDFSSAAVFNNEDSTYYSKFGYNSSQTKSARESYDQQNDVWCLGAVIYEMINGKPPFYQLKRKQSKRKLSNGPITYGQKFSSSSQKLLEKILKDSPQERIRIDQVLTENFFSMNNISKNYELQKQFSLLQKEE